MDAPLVFYFTRLLPAYRVPVLARLNERLDGRLVVCSGQPPRSSSLASLTDSASYPFRAFPLRNYWVRGEAVHAQPFRAPFRTLGRPGAILVEESPRSITLPFLLAYARRRGVGRVLWGHFSSNDRPFDPDGHWMDRYRLRLARRADACVCYTDGIADLLRPYLPDERLFVARNTLDTDTLFARYDTLAREGKAAVRQRLDLPPDRPVLVFVGRLIPEKGTDRLLDVFARLRSVGPAVLLVIGDGPERPAMEARVARDGLDGVRFVGALSTEASAPYLYAANVMLIPGYLGLAVNHAFAFGLPVASQAAPPGIRYHSPEVDFVRPGENGMLSAFGDPDALSDAVAHILAHHDRFARNALTYARSHLTLDQMVDGLEEAIRFVEGRGKEGDGH